MTALVTGASGGIGSAVAKALASQGARIALSGTREDALAAVAAEIGKDDTVIFSSRTIPGNERAVGRIQNNLARLGVEILTDNEALVHVRSISVERVATITSNDKAATLLDSWDTVAVAPGERPTLRIATESSVLALIVMSA